MKLSRLKNFSKKLSAKLLSMLTLLLVVNSCSWFSRKEPILTGDFTAKYYELPEDQEVVDYIVAGPTKLYEYVKVNESTNACEKKATPDLKKKCYEQFLEIE
jgi:hypothetical protein